MLTAREIADILGKSQVLSATWSVQGGFVFENAGQSLSVTDTDGIKLRNLYGKAELHLPIAGPPFLFGQPSTAITPKATVHMGDGDKHQLNNSCVLDAATVLACWKNSIVQTGNVNVAGFYLRQKFANTSAAMISLEAVTWVNHASGVVGDARGLLGASVLNGSGGNLTGGYGVWGTSQSYGGTVDTGAGIMGTALASAGGVITAASGISSAVYAANTGTITTGYAFYGLLSNSGATMPTAYGLKITFTGDIVTKWGFHITDGASKNYLGGWLGIGGGVTAAINYEKLTVARINSADYSRSAIRTSSRGAGITVAHENPDYFMTLGCLWAYGHPWICFHGTQAIQTLDVLKNDTSTHRGISLIYETDTTYFGRSCLRINANRSDSASAEFTNVYEYLAIGRALGLPRLNSSEMAALTNVPAGAAIWNTTRTAICAYTGSAWVTLGTTSYTDTHSDIPHTDTHGDAHTDTHGDAGHSDSHTDTPYSDVTHLDTHGDVAHGDSTHSDTHGDTHSDHTDGVHDDAHADDHLDGHSDSHTDSHTDSYIDTHTDTHGDVAHSDYHADSHNDHSDGYHIDQHTDVHSDTAHTDTHSDVAHVDSYSDVHNDTHSDAHTDYHGDTVHSDHTDDTHTDTPHTDTHSDSAHSDTPHTDTHADTAHTDVAYVDSHTDSTHTDTHGDTAHEDYHTDHSDAL